jgi:hypothetical protein
MAGKNAEMPNSGLKRREAAASHPSPIEGAHDSLGGRRRGDWSFGKEGKIPIPNRPHE